MDDEGENGDPSGLPPRAPAYDLRTGEPLDAPRPDRPSGSSDDADFSLSELGIWAPSDDAPTDEPSAPPAGPERTPPAGAPTATSPAAYQPTPPPGYGAGGPGYGAGGPGYGSGGPGYAAGPPGQPGSVPGFAPPGPWAPGGPPGYAPTAHQSTPPGAGRSRRGVALGAVVAVLVVVVAVLVAVLALGGSKRTPVAATSTATAGPSSGPTAAQPSAAASGTSGGVTSGGGDAARIAFLRTVDGILTQSQSGRQQVSSVVTGVQNSCSVAPGDASATIRQVLVNRQAVLGQANALTPPDADTATVKADLVQALNASIEASRGYQRWLDNLYATYYNTDPVGCPDGQAPTDGNYDAATAASGRATAAKQTFVAAYNPLASAAGLRTWQESEF